MDREYALENGYHLTIRPDRRQGLVRVDALGAFWYVSRNAAASLLRVYRRRVAP